MKVTLCPAPDRRVHDPLRGDVLPEDGRQVELTTYWRRRIASGDVWIVPASAMAHVPTSSTPVGDETPKKSRRRRSEVDSSDDVE